VNTECPRSIAPSPLTTRDFGTDGLGLPLEEVSSPDDKGARVWGGSRLAGGRARLAAAELATL